MSGIVISYDPQARCAEHSRTAAAMLRGLGDEQCRPALDVDAELAFASCGGVRPVWSEDNTLCVLFDGELFGDGAERPEHRIMALYRYRDESFVEALNGHFTVAVWEARRRRLLVANDRYGLRPLYTASRGGCTVWSSTPKALLADAAFPGRLNPEALADFLALNLFQGDDTLVEGVSEVPPASLAVCEGGRIRRMRYWDFALREEESARGTRKDALADAVDVLHAAARRYQRAERPVGLLLSGGVGASLALAALDRRHLHAFAVAVEGEDGGAGRRHLAAAAGVPFTCVPVAPTYPRDAAAVGLKRCAEPMNCIEFEGCGGAYATIASGVDALITGTAADEVFGRADRRPEDPAWSTQFSADAFYRQLRLFDDAELSALLQPSWAVRLVGLARHRFLDDFARCPSGRAAHRVDYWGLRQYQRRMAARRGQLFPPGLGFRPLLLDNEVVDFARSLPPSLRWGEGAIAKRVLAQLAPELTAVSAGRGAGPLQERWGGLFGALRRLFGGQRSRAAATPTPPYASALRGPLREWMMELLLDPRTLDRGIWRQEGLVNLIERCLDGGCGALTGRRILTVISFELWAREYLDRLPQAAAGSSGREAIRP